MADGQVMRYQTHFNAHEEDDRSAFITSRILMQIWRKRAMGLTNQDIQSCTLIEKNPDPKQPVRRLC
jgi:hypothetical protein